MSTDSPIIYVTIGDDTLEDQDSIDTTVSLSNMYNSKEL